MKLSIELVPSTSWYGNLRKVLPGDIWDKIRHSVYRKYGYQCGICGFRGRLNCHEIWEYDDDKHIQFFKGFIALCKYCHLVKHIGYASVSGQYDIAVKHFMIVNRCSENDFVLYKYKVFHIWMERNNYDWVIDFDEYDGEFKDLIKSYVERLEKK